MPSKPTSHRRRCQLAALGVLAVAGIIGFFCYPYLIARIHWRAATHAMAAEDFEGAHAHLRLCQRARPSQSLYVFEDARVFRRERDFRNAQMLLAKASELGHSPDQVRLEEMLQRVQQAGWRGNDSVLLNHLGKIPADDARIREVLAEAYFRDYLLPAALTQTLAWTELEPRSGLAWQLLGEIRLRLRDKGGAADAFGKALEANAGLVRARVGFADSLVSQGRPAEAVPHYEEVLRQSPRHRQARLGLAGAFLQIGRLPEAEEATAFLRFDFPRDREVTGLAGRVAVAAQRYPEAEQLLHAAATETADWLILNDLRQALARQGKTEAARVVQGRMDRLQDDLRRLDQLTESARRSLDPAPRVEAGQILIRNGLGNDGVAWLRDALRCDPGNRPAHGALADYYSAHGQPEMAAEHRRFAERRDQGP